MNDLAQKSAYTCGTFEVRPFSILYRKQVQSAKASNNDAIMLMKDTLVEDDRPTPPPTSPPKVETKGVFPRFKFNPKK